MEESHHNNKYIIELFSIKLGTKKHQINGVEYILTALRSSAALSIRVRVRVGVRVSLLHSACSPLSPHL